MKRYCSLFLVLAMAFLLTACGEESESVVTSTPVEAWSEGPDFISLTEDEFLAAVDKSFISVHVKSVPDLKFFLDLQLNVLAIRAFDTEAHMVLGESYVALELPFSECFNEVYLFAEELGILGSLNAEPVVVETCFGLAESGTKNLRNAVLAPFDSDLFNMYYANQTYYTTEGTITPDGTMYYQP